MVVQHNLIAMNANRMLNVTKKSQSKSTEKLSSGYRINRAADDAAGLSISEKMRKQIRGLTQAADNAQDGISAVQTAEGALGEVHDMLQRMNELAIKAGNGTQSLDDKKYIQDEIDQLVIEIDRISETTKFNEMYLLKGDNTKGKKFTTDIKIGNLCVEGASLVEGIYAQLNYISGVLSNGVTNVNTVSNGRAYNGIFYGETTVPGELIFSRLFSRGGANNYISGGSSLTPEHLAQATAADVTSSDLDLRAAADGTGYLEYTFAPTQDSSGWPLGNKISEIRLYSDAAASVAAAAKSDTVMTYTYSQLETFKTLMIINARTIGAGGKIKEIKVDDSLTKIELSLFADKQDEPLHFDLQVGADTTAGNKIGVDIKSMSASNLGINGLCVVGATSDRADAAVNTIAAAIQKVSTQRSALGAVQNRLEHTISNLDNIVENTTSAESAIRDTDMAEEMVKYSNNNILAQAGQAMQAQANQSNQGVLSLLG